MRKFIAPLIDAVLYLLGKLAGVVFYLFGMKFISKVGGAAGHIIYSLNSVKRNVTEEELLHLLGSRYQHGDIKNIAKRSFVNYYKRHAETIFFGSLKKEHLEKMVLVEGLEHIDEALKKGNGIIMLLSHFGSFLLPLPFLGYSGYRVNQITGKQIHGSLLAERLWTWRSREASRLPVQFKQVDKFLRPVYKALKDNEIVAIAFDGRDSTHWAVVDFMGRKARFSTGPFELARRTGATIIPTFIVRQEDDTQRIVFESPFKLSTEDDTEKALLADTQNFTGIFSGYVEKYPCHFGMVLYKSRIMLELNDKNSLFVE